MNELTTQTKKVAAPSLLMDPGAFDHMQRVGKMLALSPLFPEHLRKGTIDVAIANGVLVMNMASRLNEDPLTVAQNIYFVGGKPGWSSTYMISKANQHGVFKNPIDWEIKGSGENLSVTATAELAATGKKVSITCDMAMARAEGWTKNAKYKSMPEQMLRYRSATFLIRLYCPEVMVGVPAQIEVETGMKDITPNDIYQTTTVEREAGSIAETKPADVVEDADIVEDEKPSQADIDAAKAKAEQDAEIERLRVNYKELTGEDASGRWGIPALNENIEKAMAAKMAEASADQEQPAETPHDPDTGEVQEDEGQADQQSEDPAPKEQTTPSDSAKFDKWYNDIVNDLMDATDVAEVEDMYGPRIAQMKDQAPALHEQLMKEIAAAKE